jgi:hypothetical protein
VFEWAHLYVWQALIMLDVLVVWLIWVRTLPREGDDRAPPTPPAAASRRPDMDATPPAGRARSPLARFIVTVLAWLPVTFAVWYVVAPVLMFVVKVLCMLAVLPLGDLVSAIEQKGLDAGVRDHAARRPGGAGRRHRERLGRRPAVLVRDADVRRAHARGARARRWVILALGIRRADAVRGVRRGRRLPEERRDHVGDRSSRPRPGSRRRSAR